MLFAWTETDVDPGRIVHLIDPQFGLHTMDSGSKAERLYIVSYGYEDNSQVYYLTSFADGMQVGKKSSREELAKFLTEGNYRPTSGADKDAIIQSAAAVVIRRR